MISLPLFCGVGVQGVITLCEDSGRITGSLYHATTPTADLVQVPAPYSAAASTTPRTPSAAAAAAGAAGGSVSSSSPSTPSHSATVISTKKEDESQIMNALAKSKTIGTLIQARSSSAARSDVCMRSWPMCSGLLEGPRARAIGGTVQTQRVQKE